MKKLDKAIKNFRSDPLMVESWEKRLELITEEYKLECARLLDHLMEERAQKKWEKSAEFQAVMKKNKKVQAQDDKESLK